MNQIFVGTRPCLVGNTSWPPINAIKYLVGGLEHEFYDFPYIGNVIIPTDFHIFQRGTWWLIPLSKWIITPVINGISRVNPLITEVITHLLSGMSHQVGIPPTRYCRLLESYLVLPFFFPSLDPSNSAGPGSVRPGFFCDNETRHVKLCVHGYVTYIICIIVHIIYI